MKKLNSILVYASIVLCFFTLNLFLAQAQNEGSGEGYATRITVIEKQLKNHEDRIVKLEKTPVINNTNAAGDWQRPDGNGWWFPKDGDKVTRSSSKKVHFWCQWMNPRSELTWAECKAKYGSTDSDLCTLCLQHLVPPGGNIKNNAVGEIKKNAK